MVRLPKCEASWRAASSAAACLAGAFASELPRGLRRSACAPQCGGLSKHGLTDKKYNSYVGFTIICGVGALMTPKIYLFC
ncbi:hypothetical protein PF001_g15305 [Phytophthora fragariae]|uniref:Uncharacterized protein n=1 Tax=Phytophthora fragariae TaxID=53985 RepID=A0A6A4CZQ1_9STRA|nr:hypothetical protein PF001_g15305 [Phytophthora fragariae]